MFNNMNSLKIGDYVTIFDTDDMELACWLEEQENKGIKKHKITDIDKENNIFWVKDCDYAIWNEDVFWKEELEI